MDKAFLGPLVSALGRSFLSRRNQNKTSKSNVHRIGLLIIAAYGSWIAGIGAIILFIGNTVNSGGNSLETFIAFGVAEFHVLCVVSECICEDYAYVCVAA